MTTVSAESVRSFVLAYLSDSFKARGVSVEALPDDFDLLDGGIIDSIGTLELASAVEDELKLEVDFEALDTEELTKIGPFCAYVAENARAIGSLG